MRRTRSTVEITKFAEDEGDEDFSDIFGATGDAFAEVEESDRGSEDGGQLILSRLSNNSWLGDDDDEDDPFALMDPGWDEMDLEANIARDRHARLAKRVEELVRSMKMTQGEDIVGKLAEDLVSCSEMISVRMGRLTNERFRSWVFYGRTTRSRRSLSALMGCCPSWRSWSLAP